jgi:hypothetical protein
MCKTSSKQAAGYNFRLYNSRYHPVTKYMHPLKEKAKYLEERSKKNYLCSNTA